ncbi:MAG: O-antigen ligase family protein, partial [Duganella sp.]
IPSLLFSTNIKVSVAFYAGTFMCIVIMLIFAKMTKLIGGGIVDLMLVFYRFSVLLTAVFVILRLQERGHFLFYEASYYAIALIPYYCITFYRMFNFGFKSCITDILLILAAIILSQSVSMVLWVAASFMFLYFKSGQARFSHFVYVSIVSLIFLFLLYQFNDRTKGIVEALSGMFREPGQYLNVLILVGGNRLQRVFIAYDAFVTHPWFGVGIGALKAYSIMNFSTDSFDLDGLTASDFTADMNATNVFMEVAAEAGVVGLIGFLMVLAFIHSRQENGDILRPFKIAFYITMLSLLIESSYLRPYVWALYGVIIGLSSIRDSKSLECALMPAGLRRSQKSRYLSA